MQKDQKNVRSHGELNPALPIQSQVSLPSNHQLMKIASKNGKIEKNCEPGYLILEFFQIFNNETEKYCGADQEKSSKKIVNKFLVVFLSHSTYDNKFHVTCTVMTYPHGE